ncbi:MAG: M20/M25/M40 family metallo-hydrolase, partial [Flavobacteriales bacterium]
APAGCKAVKIALTGLKGGHSGVDIHLGRANANKVMNRFLYEVNQKFSLRITEIKGGSLRNAIPRESFVTAVIPADNENELQSLASEFQNQIRAEFKMEEKALMTISSAEMPAKVMEVKAQKDLLNAIYAAPNNVLAMSIDIPGLVETSNNLAKVTVANGDLSVQCLARSNGEAGKEELVRSIRATFELFGAEVQFQGSYPGWKPDMTSPILQVARDKYKELFKEDAKVMAIHAGLECGIIGKAYPRLDMVSFGPTIKYPHSPDEKVNIKSVEKFWKMLLAMLEGVPNR